MRPLPDRLRACGYHYNAFGGASDLEELTAEAADRIEHLEKLLQERDQIANEILATLDRLDAHLARRLP